MTSRNALSIIFVISIFSILVSLYYGHFGDPFINFANGDLFNKLNAIIPCDMCRYIRVFQYPAAFISGIALYTKDYKNSFAYLLSLSIPGFFFAVYKYTLEMGRIVQGGNAAFCDPTAATSCSSAVEVFGPYITLASLGAMAFAITIGFAVYFLKESCKKK